MIYCIECQFKGWEHQEVNAGLIQELSEICTEPICVIADYSHIKVLQQYRYMKNIQWQSCHMNFNLSGDEGAYGEYAFFLFQLLQKNRLKSGDSVFFLSSNRGLLVILALLAPIYTEVVFYCIMHAILEKVIEHGMIEEQNHLLTLRNAMRLLEINRNVNIIGYSPYTKRCLRKFLSTKILEQIFFLHHPVEKEKKFKEKELGAKMKIVLVGAGVNAKGIHIIKTVLKQSYNDDFEFIILDRRNLQQEIHDSRVNLTRKTIGFEEKEIRDAIQSADWILLAYDDTKYQVSASGIFADAIRYQTPILALDSPYIRYYDNRYPIGYIEQSEKKLAERICEVIRDRDKGRYNLFVDNLIKISKEMKMYNKKTLSSMIYKDRKGKKKGMIPILVGFAGWFLLKEYGKKTVESNSKQKIRADKNASVIAVLNQLFMAVQNQRDIAGYLKEKGYRKIAIYGMGSVGCRLYDELKNSDIEIMYGIDIRASDKLKDLDVISIQEIYEEPDIIIITPVFYQDEICLELGKKVHCRLLSIEELLNGIESEV